MGNPRNNKSTMSTELDSTEVSVVLDLPAYSDSECLKAIIAAFPEEQKPRVLGRVQEDITGGRDFIGLLVTGGGLAWFAKKVLGPSLDELGIRLRDALKAYFEKRKRKPALVTLSFASDEIEIHVEIDSDALLSFPATAETFQRLAPMILSEADKGSFVEAEKVTLTWDTQKGRWLFYQIWPKDMIRTGLYFEFDPELCEWKEKKLW